MISSSSFMGNLNAFQHYTEMKKKADNYIAKKCQI